MSVIVIHGLRKLGEGRGSEEFEAFNAYCAETGLPLKDVALMEYFVCVLLVFTCLISMIGLGERCQNYPILQMRILRPKGNLFKIK